MDEKPKYYTFVRNHYIFEGSEKYDEISVREYNGEMIISPPQGISWDYCIFVNKETKTFRVEELDGA